MDKELNKEQVNTLASLVRKELKEVNQQKEVGKRYFRKLSKILLALTGKNV